MTRLIAPVFLAASTVTATNETSKFLENQAIGVPAACAIIVAVLGAGIWAEHRFSKLEQRLDDMPCQRNGCVLKKKRKR